MESINTHFIKEVSKIIALSDLKGAAEFILRVTEMKSDEIELNEQSKNLYVILSELSELRNEELGGRITLSDVNIKKNNLRYRIISIGEVVAKTHKEYIDLSQIRPINRKVKITRNILAFLLASFIIVGGIIYKKILDDINSIGVLLVGSGTVYNYLHNNFKELFQYSINQPVVAPLECPSSIGKEVLINSYQRGEPENSGIPNMNKLPELVGMYSSKIEDSIFNKSPIQPNKKYYAIQIGADKLTAIIGGKDFETLKKIPLRGIFDSNGNKIGKIKAVELKRIIEENIDKFYLLTTSTESGTFMSWSQILTFPDSILKKYRHPRDFDFSNNTKKFITNTLKDKPWVILGSDEYSLTNYTNTDNPPKYYTYEILQSDGEVANRPLFLYGKFKDEQPIIVNWNGKETSLFELDKPVCKFWHRMLNLMKNKNQIISKNYTDSLSRNFLIFKETLWDCRCGVIPKSDIDRVTPFEMKLDTR